MKKKWYPTEIHNLIQIVQGSKSLKQGFKKAADLYGVTEHAVALQYYYNRNKPEMILNESKIKEPEKTHDFNFVIENDWTPSKNFIYDDYLIKLSAACKKLQKGQSIPLQVEELQKRYNWKDSKACANGIRYSLSKDISVEFMAKLKVHEQKGLNGEIQFIRIRHR